MIPRKISISELDLTEFIQPGDRIICGQATGEPTTLTELLVQQRDRLGGISLFLGLCLSGIFKVEHADYINFESFGPMGTSRILAEEGVLNISPVHYGQISHYIDDGYIECDVALVLLSPPGPDGKHSFGMINDYIRSAMSKARIVLAEVNQRVPWVYSEGIPDLNQITAIIETDRPLLTVPAASISRVDMAIARNVARFIEDGSVLQIGMGAIPEAVAGVIGDRQDLGFHSGMAGEFIVELIESGVITNALKPIDKGVSITAVLLGRDRLYEFADRNPLIKLRPSWHTHSGDLHLIDRLVSINSALEVDLSGQVGAEESGGRIVSAIGGQADLVRAGHRSPNGHSVIALPSTAHNGKISRIVNRLSGPVTTPRSDVDIIVTEYGWADLRGKNLTQRAAALKEIANPAHRDSLERVNG